MKDKQGILRRGCTVCPCTEYIRDSIRENNQRCKNCDHVPTKHNAVRDAVGRSDETNDSCDWESEENLEPAGEVDNVTPSNVIHAWDSLGKDSWEGNSDFYNCQFPGRNDLTNFDQNTRQYNSVYGYNHLSTVSVTNGFPIVLSTHPQPHAMLIDSGRLFVNNYIALLTVMYQVISVATQAVVCYVTLSWMVPPMTTALNPMQMQCIHCQSQQYRLHQPPLHHHQYQELPQIHVDNIQCVSK